MLSPRASSTFHWVLRIYILSYTLMILLPLARSFITSLPYLLNTQCGPTLSMLWSLNPLSPAPFFEAGCSTGLEQVAFSVNAMDHLSDENVVTTAAAPEAMGKRVAFWCDPQRSTVWSAIRGAEQCHFALLEGMYQLDVPSLWVPSVGGMVMFVVFVEVRAYLTRSARASTRKG